MKRSELDKQTLGIILYYISRLDGILGKTHLQKLLFLTDLMAAKRLKQKITAIEFEKYKHGPFSWDLNDYTDELERKGYIRSETRPFISNPKKTFTRFYLTKPIPIRQQILDELGSEKFVILDEVIDSYGNMSLQNLLDIVYNLPIVKKSEMNQILDIAKKINDKDEEGKIDL